jgi:hypothetical protein
MKTFLLYKSTGKPVITWGCLPDNVFFKGKIPEDCDLAVCPSKDYIIIDIDNHSEDKNGFELIKLLPWALQIELFDTFKYNTKNKGKHLWFKYTGDKVLLNKASGLGVDLRVSASKDSCGGYVKWHPRDTIEPTVAEIMAKSTSKELNEWIESLFS